MHALEELIKSRRIFENVNNRLYRREAIQGVLFPEGKYFEDVFWSYQAIARARQVSVIGSRLYFYRRRPGSITMSAYSLKNLQAIEGQLQRLDFIQRHFPEAELTAQRRLLYASLMQFYLSVRNLKGGEKKRALHFLNGALRRCLLPRGSVYRKKGVYWACVLWGALPLKLLQRLACEIIWLYRKK